MDLVLLEKDLLSCDIKSPSSCYPKVYLLGSGCSYENTSLLTYLMNHGYTTLVKYLTDAKLSSLLTSTGPFTVFAPSDAAFAHLPTHTTNFLASHPQNLADVLKYHIVQEILIAPLISGVVNRTTLQGQSLEIAKLLVNGFAAVHDGDIVVANGVIQPIHDVLIPHFPATESIAQIIIKDDHRFRDLVVALILTDLLTPLGSGDFTLFAPVDSAFGQYRDNLLSTLNGEIPPIYKRIFKYHVVPGGRMTSQLQDGQSLFTLDGTVLHVTKDAIGQTWINNIKIIDADIEATNGVVHVINDLLIPSNIYGI
ncbi:hypothetical protein CHS0354_040060 [Potamilus streckersoni]|uniref:FAS1 domain-containing protein n=1 Tax=Potamilus streckersoni TaxID=2493646 RepID=A0AAE0SU44_9BIVA|nr:hypothetical protein CHS0354_040060 [Potamilus streckersoni]